MISEESTQPSHPRLTAFVLRLVGADARDAPGMLAHHHVMAFAFVLVNLVMATGLAYSGLPQLAPDFSTEARVAAALFLGFVVFLLDLYVVAVRYRLPEREPQGALDRALAFVISRSELLPRLIMTTLLVVGLGSLLSFTINAESIDEIKDDRARALSKQHVDDDVQAEVDHLASLNAELTKAKGVVTAADTARAERGAEEATARDLRNCELHRVPPPKQVSGCTGDAGYGPAYTRADKDWVEARRRTDKAEREYLLAGRRRDRLSAQVTAQQSVVDSARAVAEADPTNSPAAARLDGWSATRSAFDEATKDAGFVEKFWPEFVIFVIDVTPLMLILFGGRQESLVNRDRRLRRERARAAGDDARFAEDQSAMLEAAAAEARLALEIQAVAAQAAVEDARADAEADREAGRLLREQRIADARADAAHRSSMAAERRQADIEQRPERPAAAPVDRVDRVDTWTDTTDVVPPVASGDPHNDDSGVRRARQQSARSRDWEIKPLRPTDTATAQWEPGAEIRFPAGVYRLVAKIAESEGSDPYSSSSVWFAEAVGDTVLSSPAYCAVKAMLPGPRLEAERAFLGTVGLQAIGLPAHVGTAPFGEYWAVGYQYYPRTDAARYAFGTLDREPITVALLLEWLHQALEALRGLWHNGLLHNDMKLRNLLLTGAFGPRPDALRRAVEPLWKILINDFDTVCRRDAPETVTALTLEECAPEVAEAAARYPAPLPLGVKSDLYGLFAAFYQLATGGYHPRFSTPEQLGLVEHGAAASGSRAAVTHDHQPMPVPPSVLVPDLPSAFSRLLELGVHPDPRLRFRGVGEEPEHLYAHVERAIRSCREQLTPEELGVIVAHDGPLDGYPAPAGWPTYLDSELSA